MDRVADGDRVADRHWVGGAWVAGDGPAVQSASPIDGTPLGRAVWAGPAALERALAAADAARDATAALSIAERAAALVALADGLEARTAELAGLITLENGCPSQQSARLQVGSAVGLLRAFAGLVQAHRFDELRTGLRGGRVRVMQRPVGVVAGISPWNVPVFLACMKIAPALAAGCPLVLKPPVETAFSNAVLAEAVAALPLPAGTLNVLTADRDIGRALVADARVHKVSFTGSVAAGQDVAAIAAPRMARLTLELGGKGAALLLDDVDLDAALPELLAAMLQNNGQVCGAQSRVLVPRARWADIVDRLAAAIDAQVVGDPRDAATQIGPVVSPRQRERIAAMVQRALDAGSRRCSQRSALPDACRDGAYVLPMLLQPPSPDAEIAQAEVFGPVVVALPYDDEAEAVAIANGTPYGLSASVWSADPARAARLAPRLRAGTVSVNTRRILDFGAPFGGLGRSGVGRELGPEGINAHLEPTSILLPT